MKTSYDIEDSPDLASVVNSHPDTSSSSSSSSMETENNINNQGDLGYDIMDDIQKSQSNYITEYIVIPLCIIGVIALVVFLYLKFIKKSGEPEQADADVEKQALQDNENGDNNDEEAKKPEEKEEEKTKEEEAVVTTENVGQEEAEKKTEEEA